MSAGLSLGFCLLEGIIDSYRKCRMCLLGQTVHGGCHAVEEEGLSFFLAAMAVGRGYQLLGFRYCQGRI
ncbi:hypothetical protein D3C76_1776300 [compost metagenome]